MHLISMNTFACVHHIALNKEKTEKKWRREEKYSYAHRYIGDGTKRKEKPREKISQDTPTIGRSCNRSDATSTAPLNAPTPLRTRGIVLSDLVGPTRPFVWMVRATSNVNRHVVVLHVAWSQVAV